MENLKLVQRSLHIMLSYGIILCDVG